MPVAVCCITVSSFTAQNTSDMSVQMNNEYVHICAICGARLPATRHLVLSLAALTSAVPCRSERKGGRELAFDLRSGYRKEYDDLFLHPTSEKPKIQLVVWEVNVGRLVAEPLSWRWVLDGNVDLKLSWPWLRWWVVVMLGCFFSSLLSCFRALKGWRGLAVGVTVTVKIDTPYAHIIDRGADPLYNYACACMCPYPSNFECAHVYQSDVWGQTQLKFRPGPSLTPQPLQSWPWLILLSFTFLSEIYYLLPWLVFYGLMTSNRCHHQGQLQLHPLCLSSSKCNLVCCLGILLV